jgi:hypothetical protein
VTPKQERQIYERVIVRREHVLLRYIGAVGSRFRTTAASGIVFAILAGAVLNAGSANAAAWQKAAEFLTPSLPAAAYAQCVAEGKKRQVHFECRSILYWNDPIGYELWLFK